jgi:divalent metal cation (Fe/Co/Zn/Cd) transporter
MIQQGSLSQREERFNSADRVIKIGFWLNAVLMTVKLAAGYYEIPKPSCRRPESASDFVAMLATLFARALGRQPGTKNPYGHGRAESILLFLSR